MAWNYTRTCNLKCKHCYAHAEAKTYAGELSTEEAKAFIDDLADFKVPVILFSGGEPLVREDFFELAAYAREKGIRATLSTNGTLITPEVAQKSKTTALAMWAFLLTAYVRPTMPFVALTALLTPLWRAFATVAPLTSGWACALPSAGPPWTMWTLCWICWKKRTLTGFVSTTWSTPVAVKPW